MKMMQKHLLLALLLLLTAVPMAHAHKTPPKPEPKTAPEVDPALALSGLTLLAGSLVVARARRSKG